MSDKAASGRARFWMDLVATLAAVGGCALLVSLNWSRLFPAQPKIPTEAISLEGSTVRGNTAATVVVVEFSDYMCPFCVRFESEVLPELSRRHIDSGQVQWAFRHLPLERLHPGASKASEAALCAGRDGRFWEMHAALFIQPKGLDESRLLSLGQELGLNDQIYGRCVREGETAEQVRQDLALAGALEITGTPAFLIGRRQGDGKIKVSSVIDGARAMDVYEEAIASALEGETQGYTTILAAGIVATIVIWIGLSRRRSRVPLKKMEEVKTT